MNITAKSLLAKPFVRHVFTMASGTSIAQALLILTTPFLTRLYSPMEFGGLSVFITLSGVVSVVSCGRYEFALLSADSSEDAANLLFLALSMATIISGFFLLLSMTFQWQLARIVGGSDVIPSIYLLAISIFLSGLFQTLNYWNTRTICFQRLAIARVIQSVTTITSQIVLAFMLDEDSSGLIQGYIIGQLFGSSVLIYFMLKEDRKVFYKCIHVDAMLMQAKLHYKFPLFNAIPSLLDSLRGALPVLFLNYAFGATVTGLYSLAIRLLWLPSSLVGSSISQVLFQRLVSEFKSSGKTGTLVENAFRGLVAIAFPYLAVMAFAPLYVGTVFGQEWTQAGAFVLILSPAAALMFVLSSLSVATTALNRQELSAAWQFVALLMTGAALAGSSALHSAVSSIVSLTLANIILYVIYAKIIFWVSGASFRRIFLGQSF